MFALWTLDAKRHQLAAHTSAAAAIATPAQATPERFPDESVSPNDEKSNKLESPVPLVSAIRLPEESSAGGPMAERSVEMPAFARITSAYVWELEYGPFCAKAVGP